MDKDFSRLLYDKYFGLSNRNIEVKLKDGTVFRCVIIGFYKKGEEDTPYITKWHIIGATDKNRLGINPLDLLNGNTIDQQEIAEVKFMEDGSVLKFE
jgi:hypothetical protein